MLPRINHASTPPRISASPEIPAHRIAVRLDLVADKTGPATARPSDIVQATGQCDAKSQLQVAARRDKGGNPSGKLRQTDAESEQNGCALDRFGNGCTDFCINPADAWQHAVQSKIAKQTEDKHSITQHRRHSSAASAAGSISINEMSDDPRRKSQRKRQ